MKLFPLNIPRLRALNAKWRTAFTSLRLVIPPGLGVIHIAALSDGNEDPPTPNSQLWPIGLMQVPRRIGQRLGFRSEDLKKTPNNIYTWAKMTNQNARSLHNLYNANYGLWTKPTYDFWLTVHTMFLLGTSFTTLWGLARPTTAHVNHVFTRLLDYMTRLTGAGHIGQFSHHDIQLLAKYLNSAQRALVTLDGPDHATAAFGSEMSVANPGSVMTVLQACAT